MQKKKIYINLHTHTPCKQSLCIVSYDFFTDYGKWHNIDHFFSLGFHPWFLDFSKLNFSEISAILNSKYCIAIGELGLDKSSKYVHTFDIQLNFLNNYLDFFLSFNKPLIFHSVRAYSEILFLKKLIKKGVWILHDYNSSLQMTKDLVKYGFYFSFGKNFFSNTQKFSDIIKVIPLERIFFETDVHSFDIKELYKKAASIMNIDEFFLISQIQKNFRALWNC